MTRVRILLLGTDAPSLEEYRTMLTEAGYELAPPAGGSPDLILLALGAGVERLGTARRLHEEHQVPVVLLAEQNGHGQTILHESGDVKKVIGVCVDVTERKRSVDLRPYIRAVQRAQEEERQRISRELHDDLCQKLSGMKFGLEVLEDEIRTKDRSFGRRLRTFTRQCEDLIVGISRMSTNLHPSVLDDFGLVAALALLARRFEMLYGIPIDLDLDETARPHIEPQLEITIYRIAQEALTNVARHASARRAYLKLERDDQSVMMRIGDDGLGFAADAPGAAPGMPSGMGLVGMRHRTELLGGRFAVASSHLHGTTITVTFPTHAECPHEEDPHPHRR